MALFRAGRLQNVYFYPKWDSTTVIDFLDVHEVDAAIFSTVTEYDLQAIAILRQRLPYFLKFDHSSELPIKIGYATPETLGLDRIAAVVGAAMQCPDKAVLIVDAGTCVTYVCRRKHSTGHPIEITGHARTHGKAPPHRRCRRDTRNRIQHRNRHAGRSCARRRL